MEEEEGVDNDDTIAKEMPVIRIRKAIAVVIMTMKIRRNRWRKTERKGNRRRR